MAIDFTLQYQEKVNGLILVGAVVGGFPYTRHFNNRGGHLPSGFESGEQRRVWYALNDPYEMYSGNAAAREKVARLVQRYPRKGHGAGSGARLSEPAYRRLHEIKIPALILVGEFDIPDVHAHAGAMEAGIVGSKRDIVPKSGHLIPIEQPELFNSAVGEFLKGISSH